MLRDPILDEIRCNREEQAVKHGFEVKAILVDARRRQRRSKRRIVSFVQPTAVKVLK
jgi:ribosomal protein L14